MAERKLSLVILGKATGALAALKSTGDGAQSLGKRLTSLLPSFKTVALAGTAAFGAVAASAYGAVQAAAQDQESQRKLADQLRRTTGATAEQIAAVEQHISKQMMLTGVTDDALRPAMSALVRATGDVSLAQNQLGLALDISAATGKDLESVSLALGRAFTGNISALTRLGIPIDENTKKSKNLSELITTLNTQFGGAAAGAADTFSGRLRILQVSIGEAVEGIGYALLPIAEKLVAFFQTRVVPVIQAFSDKLAAGGGLRDALLAAAAQAGPFADKVINALEGVAKAFVYVNNAGNLFVQGVTILAGSGNAYFQGFKNMSIDAFRTSATEMVNANNKVKQLYLSVDEVTGAFAGFRTDLLGTAAASVITQRELRALEDQAKRTAGGVATVVPPFIGPLLAGYGASASAATTTTDGWKKSLEELMKTMGGAGSATKTATDKMKAFGDVVRQARDATREQTEAVDAVAKAKTALDDKTQAVTDAQARFNGVLNGFPKTARESIDAAKRFADAQRSVRDSGLAVYDAVRSVADAEKALADLRARAADAQQVAGAERSLARSKFDVEEATFRVAEAEQRVADLRAGGVTGKELRRAEIDLEEARFAVADSLDSVREAEQRLNAERNAQATPEEIADAEMTLERAKYTLADALDAQRTATEEQTAAQDYLNEITNGATEGSKLYDDALRDLTDAKTAAKDASDAYTKAMSRERDALIDLKTAQANLDKAKGAVGGKAANRIAAGLGVSLGAGGSIIENIAAVSAASASPAAPPPMQVTMNVQSGISNPVETANEILDALRQWERSNGNLRLFTVT